MKTLFLTDLDGTLLNSNAQLSDFSKSGLNKLIKKGMLFSLATARTFATVVDLFEGVNLNLPFILMNGVVIYDPVEQKNVVLHSVNTDDAKFVVGCYEKHNKYPMLYFMRDGCIEIVYKSDDNPYKMSYVSQRDSLKRKIFRCVENYDITQSDNLIYIVVFTMNYLNTVISTRCFMRIITREVTSLKLLSQVYPKAAELLN